MPSDQNLITPDAKSSEPAPAATDSLETPETPGGGPAAAPPPPRGPLWSRLRRRVNVYLLIFILLIIAAAAVIYFATRGGGKTPSGTSLTSQQLSAIQGNTTLVGDAHQTLDVQSNSIFEGQVLVRSDLDVAGALKVGNGISLPSITVVGNGAFGQLGINGGLNVGGNTTLQGQLTVNKGLTVNGSTSFGALSASSLSVTSLQLNGDLGLSRHIATSGGTPGRSYGPALGGGGTASVSGSDTAGTVTINTGGGPPAGCFVTVNFIHGYASTPHIIISPSNSAAGGLQYYTNRTSSNFSVCTASAPAASTTYIFDYVVFD